MRKLKIYNSKTSIIRNINLILLGMSELVYSFSIWSYSLTFYFAKKSTHDFKPVTEISPNCTVSTWLAVIDRDQPMIVWYGTINIGALRTIYLIIFSTRCLQARYLQRPIRKIVIKLATSFSVQAVILLACSTIYTFLILLVLGPIFLFISFLILIYDSKKFLRFLIFNNRSVYFQYKNLKYYENQAQLHTWYKVISITVLISFFFGILSLTSRNLFYVIEIFFSPSICFLNKIYGFKIDTRNETVGVNEILEALSLYIFPFCAFVFVLFNSFPLLIVSSLSLYNGIWQRKKNERVNRELLKKLIEKQYY